MIRGMGKVSFFAYSQTLNGSVFEGKIKFFFLCKKNNKCSLWANRGKHDWRCGMNQT